MDAQDYLNQIAAKPVAPRSKSKLSRLWSNKFVLVGVIGTVGLILIAIVGVILGAGSGGPKEKSYTLLLHIDNTLALVTEYQPSVKSSDLRSSSASLAGVLSNTSRGMVTYLEQKYNYRDNRDINSNLVEQATLEKDGLNSELFEAKINGLLDRIFAHKMAYEISKLTSEEAELYGETKDDALRTVLSTSYDSLNNLYAKFNDFSETK